MQLTPRQAQFADVALDLLARGGMASVTFRTVASASGFSLGAVQKAFSSKDVMLRAMFDRLRQTSAAPALGDPGRPTLVGWLTELTLTILPLDAARRAAQLSASAFGELAGSDPAIASAIAMSDHELVGQVARLMRRGIDEGEVPADTVPDAVARLWLALAEGLATQLLYDPRPESAVRSDVTLALTRLLS